MSKLHELTKFSEKELNKLSKQQLISTINGDYSYTSQQRDLEDVKEKYERELKKIMPLKILLAGILGLELTYSEYGNELETKLPDLEVLMGRVIAKYTFTATTTEK